MINVFILLRLPVADPLVPYARGPQGQFKALTAYPCSPISFGTSATPKGNWNQWLCKNL